MLEVSLLVLEVLEEEEGLVALSLEEKEDLAYQEVAEAPEELEVAEARDQRKSHQSKDLEDLGDELEIFLDRDSAYQMLWQNEYLKDRG